MQELKVEGFPCPAPLRKCLVLKVAWDGSAVSSPFCGKDDDQETWGQMGVCHA